MALATQCPHCHTTFRVAADQLKLRGGIVRCGACQGIFDGSAHLVDLEQLAASKARQAPAAASEPAAAPAAAPAVLPEDAAGSAPDAIAATAAEAGAATDTDTDTDADAGTGEPPVYTVDFDTAKTFDALAVEPETAPEPALEPAAPPEPAAPRAQVWRNGNGKRFTPAAAADAAADATPAAEAAATDEAAVASVAEVACAGEAGTANEAEPADEAEAADEAAAPSESAALAEDGPAPAPAIEAEVDVDVEAEDEPSVPAVQAAPPPAAAYAPQGRIEPTFGPPADEAPDAPSGDEPALHDEPARHEEPAAQDDPGATAPADDRPLPLRASAAGADSQEPAAAPASPAHGAAPKSARTKAVEARGRRSKLTPTRIDAPRLRVPVSAEADEPEFVKRSRKQEASGRSRRLLTIAGTVLLALLLAVQLLATFRNVLAARYPGLKPALGAGCAVLGCRIGLPMQIESLTIETGELSTLGVDTYSLNTLLRNQSGLAQAWPSIQLELTDAGDRPLLRRVFGPADYLPQGVAAGAGFGARSEQPVRLNFALSGLKPSGYHMIVFYP